MPKQRTRKGTNTTHAAAAVDQERLALERTWSRRPGFIGWLTSTDHKEIGLRFIVTAFIFFLLAGILALLMRIQLAVPRNNFLGPDLYNQFFTTHGTAMMFLFAVPVMEGMGIYLVPLMVGARSIAFPRLINFSYYVYLTAGCLLFGGLILNIGPDMGWFSYTPLSGPEYTPGKRVDLWSQMVSLVETSSLAGAVAIIVTAFKLRAPGMSLGRVPIFVWTEVVISFMILFAMPAVMLTSTMLAADRMPHINTQFFNQAEGGDHLLWQHLFWFFAHPDVYIIFLPATAFISSILPTFTRRPMFGYPALVLSLIATAFIGFGVWVHHMFATPLPQLGQGLFTASSLMIVLPTGVQFFCWIATLWSGRLRFKVAVWFVLGFFANFLIGGLTGVMLASVSLDLQVHDTFFVVAHLHYVLIGGALFPLFGAFYYWFPKMTGRLLSERAGMWNFGLMFIGFNLAFFPMHNLGFYGMTRRVYTYLPETEWGGLNLAATIGAGILGIGILVFILNVLWSRRNGEMAGDDPWGGETLEWATTSPPPPYNFLHPPTVQGRSGTWEKTETTPTVTGLSVGQREVLCTTIHDGTPDHRYHLAEPSLWPLGLALVVGAMLIGLMFHPIAFPIGAGLILVMLLGWFWPTHEPHPIYHPDDRPSVDVQEEKAAPAPAMDVMKVESHVYDSREPTWWGNVLFLLIETMSVALLTASYFYLWQNNEEWPPTYVGSVETVKDPLPQLLPGTLNLAILLGSCMVMFVADRAARKMQQTPVLQWLGLLTVLGSAAILLRFQEFGAVYFSWDENAYGSIVWAILFAHLVYLLVATLESLVLFVWTIKYGLDDNKASDVTLLALNWYWTAGSWVLLFAVVYVAPRLL